MDLDAESTDAGGPSGSYALALQAGTGAAAPAGLSALNAAHLGDIQAVLETRLRAVYGAGKAALLEMCHAAGLSGNHNDSIPRLRKKLVAHYSSLADEAAAAAADVQRSPLGTVNAPGPSAGLARGFLTRPAARTGRSLGPILPGSSEHEEAPVAPPPRRPSSPQSPPGKRPRAAAPPFFPAASTSRPSSPADEAHDAAPAPGAPPRRPPPAMPSPAEARRRSHAAASVRPARLDEVLDLQAEMRRRQVCLRGLRDSPAEDASSLEGEVARVLEALVGHRTDVADCHRVGRFQPDRPRPVIVRFNKLAEKIDVLRGKGILYGGSCPEGLRGLRLYHDLSAGQLDWKRRLTGAYEGFLGAQVRAVWRRGYRLFALLEGCWVEFYPTSVLVN